ncbi:1-acyl-sn-glycerol-3-phosphate acyltransferase [Sinimarinibacterium sp. CAU 1509]|uniref:lysophospholipid acyltransferase family protein n=1 Tax=Sinimarinibacterium sp. CAU 1509 TaxID=2562283 RepID=UPI0010AC0D91|nr:lysophospholipid acyltransferase family protein [Sinimarinibacterium sp. CAU 1509]TJY65022.1 1-acyl-sn-glycerol-3-phosphate acyltransferase [Sinimarinibacterium sp. CAU 1509]
MKKLLGCVLTPIFLVVWLLLLYLFHGLQFVALKLFGGPAQQRVVAALCGLLVLSLWLLGTRTRVHFSERLPTDRPIIFVANHQNKLDISGINWFLRRHTPRFVSKIELARGIPSISYNLRHSGAALIDRDDPRQALKEIGRLGKLIEQTRSSAVIFPEGTRSLTGELAPFQTAGVKILLKNAPSAWVVPIYIHDTWTLNRYGSFPMSVGETLSWSVLPAIDPAGKTSDQVAALAEASIRAEREKFLRQAQAA